LRRDFVYECREFPRAGGALGADLT
jgi:hypothetical protein